MAAITASGVLLRPLDFDRVRELSRFPRRIASRVRVEAQKSFGMIRTAQKESRPVFDYLTVSPGRLESAAKREEHA